MPHLYLNNYWSFNKEEMLWQLVSTKRRKNPEALEETREFIQQHKLEDKFNIWFHTTNDPWNKTLGHLPKIQAFTRLDNTLGFRMMNKEISFSTPKVRQLQNNHSSGLKIRLGVYNEAFNKGSI
jgi:hypothetical protein